MDKKRAGRPQAKWKGKLGEPCTGDLDTAHYDEMFELLFEHFKIVAKDERKWKILSRKLAEYIKIPAFSYQSDNQEFFKCFGESKFYREISALLEKNNGNLQKSIGEYITNHTDSTTQTKYDKMNEDTLEKKFRKLEEKVKSGDLIPFLLMDEFKDKDGKTCYSLTLDKEKNIPIRHKKGK